MSRLIINDLRCKHIYIVLAAIFVLAFAKFNFSLKMLALLAALITSAHILKDRQYVWSVFFTYPLSARKIVLSKMVVITMYMSVVMSILWFALPYDHFQIAATLFTLFTLCFLLVNYLVADGYCGGQQVNVLAVLSNVFFFFCIYNQQDWFPLLQAGFSFIPYLIIVSFILILILSPNMMKKRNQNQIALAAIMGSVKMMHELTYASFTTTHRVCMPKIENYTLRKTTIDDYFVICLYACKEVQYLLVILMFLMLLQMKGLCLLALMYVAYKWIYAFCQRRKALIVIGVHKK